MSLVFPLPIYPSQSYRSGGCEFGNKRSDTQDHAGCDLVVPAGTEVYAVADGVVWYLPGFFFVSAGKSVMLCEDVRTPADATTSAAMSSSPDQSRSCGWMQVRPNLNTYEMAIITDDIGILRYGEVALQVPDGVKQGGRVTAGQHIGWIALQNGAAMLHFEWFQDRGRKDSLTNTKNTVYLNVPPGNYLRRSDLDDPTDFLTGLLLRDSSLRAALEQYR